MRFVNCESFGNKASTQLLLKIRAIIVLNYSSIINKKVLNILSNVWKYLRAVTKVVWFDYIDAVEN